MTAAKRLTRSWQEANDSRTQHPRECTHLLHPLPISLCRCLRARSSFRTRYHPGPLLPGHQCPRHFCPRCHVQHTDCYFCHASCRDRPLHCKLPFIRLYLSHSLSGQLPVVRTPPLLLLPAASGPPRPLPPLQQALPRLRLGLST